MRKGEIATAKEEKVILKIQNGKPIQQASSGRYFAQAVVSSVMLLSATIAVAEEAKEQSSAEIRKTKVLSRVQVVADAESADQVPGAAHVINQKRLDERNLAVDDIHRVLRDIPGVNIQEEEGYGLRPNIGLRGAPSDRSASITLMEDGVLIAPAPYSAPAAYYFPTVGRMEGVEVIKGASQVKYGPNTTGGSLNLLSTSIPQDLRIRANVAAGQDEFKKISASVGRSYDNAGFLLQTYQAETSGFKELDGGGDTGFQLEDYVAKIRVNSNADQKIYHELEYKIQASNQLSNDTYLGLTDEDFASTPFRRYAGSQLDNIDVDNQLHMVRHFVDVGGTFDVTTTLYQNNVDRNWFKLDQVNKIGIANILDNPETYATELGFIKGGTSPDDTFSVRKNQRSYTSEGAQVVVGSELELGNTEHDVEVSARYHEDEEDRFQNDEFFRMDNGSLVQTSVGAPGSQDNRIGSAEAWAFYAQDKIGIDDLTLIPGVRYERIDYERADYGKTDPTRSGSALKVSKTSINTLIPGLGAHYQLTDSLSTFAGVHKGFSPPGPRAAGEVEEEESINYELGTNYKVDSFDSEVVLFYNDYDNLLGADTASSGGAGTGDLFNGGEVQVFGVESSIRYDLASSLDTAFQLPWYVTYTYTNAEFRSDFNSEFFGLVSTGDDVPYIPQHQFSTGIAIRGEQAGLAFDAHFADSMLAVPGEAGVRADTRTDSAFVVDVTGEVKIADGVKLYSTVQNIFDREYVVARRPAGSRPGLPLTFLAGLKFDL